MSLLTGLESHWKLNEAASIDNAVDYGAAGNTLTEVNEPDPNVDIGGSRHVTLADNQYFTLADNASVSTGNIAFTFAGHFKFEALTSETDLITKRDQPVTGNVEYLMVANPTKFAWGTGDAVGGLDAITSTDLDIVTG
ncbi:MAG TPA: hypothetical protein VNT76_23415, partial [Candidatus Binatus sp.]|nr:hypothetical protein [Candidatus Binatus sp.]